MKHLYLLAALSLFVCCQQSEPSPVDMPDGHQVFDQVPASHSQLKFRNQITQTEALNFLTFDGLHQGAGVGIGDFNKDGLPDVVFAGNMVADKIYINQGDLVFEDITATSGLADDGGWSTGVAIADINDDGYDDIYLCRFLYDDPQRRINKLYINNGDLTFTESAVPYKLHDPGYSIMASFLDYDRDGLLDIYMANQPPNSTAGKDALKGKKDFFFTDRIFKNNGDGTFAQTTGPTGVKSYNYSLSATTSDLNQDGYVDIYVASDYDEPDMMYINNGQGKFTNTADQSLRHMSNFSMGADIADINNDGWMDIYTADMVANDNARLKTNMSGMNPEKFWSLAENGYHHQYMFNALQLNNADGNFSEIAQLAGLESTDWSWTPLLVDFDNDGHRDVFVTNGLLHDMRDNDYLKAAQKEIDEIKAAGGKPNLLEIAERAPSTPIENFMYSNKGDLQFEDVSAQWGVNFEGYSNGAAYADFDNDGDLDLIVTNHNDLPALYRNTTADNNYHTFLRFIPEADAPAAQDFHVRVDIEYDGQIQAAEMQPVRGYMSTSEMAIHFGLGTQTMVDKVRITWPSGEMYELTDIPANQVIALDKSLATSRANRARPSAEFKKAKSSPISYVHQENEYDDYAREILLPAEMSHLGPDIAVGDINGDGNEDLYISGAIGQPGGLFQQSTSGEFQAISGPWTQHAQNEDIMGLFFDADGDGDQDLYVASGGNEYDEGDSRQADRLYINEGGSWRHDRSALPAMRISTGAVAASDIDGDGDLDLFVGGRQVPGQYGVFARSYILRNDRGKFTDTATEVYDDLKDFGMVSTALWHDVDGDGDEDLITAGEWMPITVLKNDDGRLSDATSEMGMDGTVGWWNELSLADLNGDGEMDLVAGNLGKNIKYRATAEEPFKIFVKDFDDNGTHDVYLGYYDSDGICYPVRGRQCSSQQMPFIKEKFPNYNTFSKATIEDVLAERMDGATVHEATQFASVWIDMDPAGWKVHELPAMAQIAPVHGIIAHDWNRDGHTDLMVAGNYYNREVETTRSDAGTGYVLLGDGKGEFTAMTSARAGLDMIMDVRDIAAIATAEGMTILVANNDGPVQAYEWSKDATM